MATSEESPLSNPNNSEDYEDDDDEEEEDDDEDEEAEESEEDIPSSIRAKAEALFRRISTVPVPIRVHDVIIKGNIRTKRSLIEDEVLSSLRSASTMQDLIAAAALANQRLHRLRIFDRVSITLDEGPPELPGTTNVIIAVIERGSPVTGDLAVFSKPETRACSLEGSLKLKNSFGYGEILDVSGTYGWDHVSELSAGFSLPRLKAVPTPLTARVSLLTEDWLKFSSYKDGLLGVSLGFLSYKNHDLTCNITCCNLTDPSKSVRQLGDNLLSSIKYTFKVDRRNSHLRPTHGWAFLSSSQVGGLGLDNKSSRFVRQDFDLRGALPLGFSNAAVNLGISAGVIMPWGKSFLSLPSPSLDRFHMIGNSTPVYSFGGSNSLLGFRMTGFGPTDLHKVFIRSNDKDELGGNIAVSAFADISFDLPLKLLRDRGIHGHVFATAGNVAKITEETLKEFSPGNLLQTFRSSIGLGVVISTSLLRMEMNYCCILKQSENVMGGKTGIQINFSSPS